MDFSLPNNANPLPIGSTDTIFITGGGGFVGSNLARFLAPKHRVVVFDNFSENPAMAPILRAHGITVIRGDVRKKRQLEGAIRKYKPRVIYHLAAVHFLPQCDKAPAKTWATNVGGMQNLLDTVAKMPQKPYLIFSSSMAVYADLPHAIRETHPTKPLDIYGKSKLASEKLLRNAHRTSGINYTIFRFSNIYGLHSTVPHIIPRIVAQLRNDTVLRLGNTAPKRDFIHVSDIVSGLVAALQHQKPHAVYNLGTGIATSIRKLVALMGEITGQEIVISTVPANTVRRNDRMNLQTNIRAARRDLNWQPKITLTEGLREILITENLVSRRKSLWYSITQLVSTKR